MKFATALGLLLVATGTGRGLPSLALAQTCPLPYDAANRDPDGLASEPDLSAAIATLRDHIAGSSTLDAIGLDAAKNAFNANVARLTMEFTTMEAALDLIDEYESNFGPMFLGDSSVGGFSLHALTDDGHELKRAVIAVQQGVLDEIYHGSVWSNNGRSSGTVDRPNAPLVKDCAALLEGRKWHTSRYLPGAVDPPADTTVVHDVSANITFAPAWGRPVAFTILEGTPEGKPNEAGFNRRLRPLGGLYLSPGQIATVTVPPVMVGAGFTIQVGSQTVDTSNKWLHRRNDRITTSFPIDADTTHVANPLGGGLFVRIPYGSDLDVVTVQVSGGVVASASFTMTDLKTTTEEEWNDIRINAPAPWVNLETEAFFTVIPTSTWSRC